MLDSFLELLDFVLDNFSKISPDDVPKVADIISKASSGEELPPEMKEWSAEEIHSFLKACRDEIAGLRDWKHEASFTAADFGDKLAEKVSEIGARLMKKKDELVALHQEKPEAPSGLEPPLLPKTPTISGPDAGCVLKYSSAAVVMFGLLVFFSFSAAVLPYQTDGTITYTLISGTNVIRLDVAAPPNLNILSIQAPRGWNLATNLANGRLSGFTLVGGSLGAGESVSVRYVVSGAAPRGDWTVVAISALGQKETLTAGTQVDYSPGYQLAAFLDVYRSPIQALCSGAGLFFLLVGAEALKWRREYKAADKISVRRSQNSMDAAHP